MREYLMETVCETCGNEMDVEMLSCPFCGMRRSSSGIIPAPGKVHRVVNIERGKPTVSAALAKLGRELEQARIDKVKVVTVIHGYGASGKGGSIRKECRRQLDYYTLQGTLRGYIFGEEFSKKAGPTRTLLRRIPQLSNNSNLGRGNKGITVVEL